MQRRTGPTGHRRTLARRANSRLDAGSEHAVWSTTPACARIASGGSERACCRAVSAVEVPEELPALRPFDELLVTQELGDDRFVVRPAGRGFLFGGLTRAMTLAAVGRTVEAGLVPLSLRTSFVTAGEWGAPTAVAVERVSDSR